MTVYLCQPSITFHVRSCCANSRRVTKSQSGSSDTLDHEGQRPNEDSLQVLSFENGEPARFRQQFLGRLRLLDLVTNASVFVLDIVTVDVADKPSK